MRNDVEGELKEKMMKTTRLCRPFDLEEKL
jgi:hypothetical protein